MTTNLGDPVLEAFVSMMQAGQKLINDVSEKDSLDDLRIFARNNEASVKAIMHEAARQIDALRASGKMEKPVP